MTPRYNLAVKNLEQLFKHTRAMLSEKDVKQIEQDLFYLKIFRHVPFKQDIESSE